MGRGYGCVGVEEERPLDEMKWSTGGPDYTIWGTIVTRGTISS